MMFRKSEQDKKLEQMLRQLDARFEYDKQGVKRRLLMNIEHIHPNAALGKRLGFHYGIATSLTIVFIMVGTFTFADASKPGDSLYWLDKLQEQVLLKVPRSDESRAVFKTKIINERMKELNNIPHLESHQAVQLKATEETQRNIIDAIEETSQAKQNYKLKGKHQSSSNMSKVLIELDSMGARQESEIKTLKDTAKDEETQKQLEIKLEAIKKARERARKEAEELEDIKNETEEFLKNSGSDNSGEQKDQIEKEQN